MQRDDAREVELSLHDPDRFGVVFDRYFGEIHGYVAKRIGTGAGDDIAAETFLTAFGQRARFDPGRGSVRGWLYGIVANHMSRYRRQEVRAYRAMARSGLLLPEEGHADRVVDRVAASALRRRPSRRALFRFGLPAAAIAASAAVFIAIAVQAPGTPVQPGETGVQPFGGGPTLFRLPGGATGGPAGTTATGRDILLSAARVVARAPQPATGRYWETSGLVGNFLRVGPPDDPYVILEKVAVQQWAAQSPRVFSPNIWQALGVQFASAADQRAWRRDGSPTRWTEVGQENSLASPQGVTDAFAKPLSAARGKPTPTVASLGSQAFQVGNQNLSLRGLLALPADPASLRALLMTNFDHGDDSPASYLFQATPAMLEEPVTPAVRSALYRMLASLPGVRSLGVVQDVAGQEGSGSRSPAAGPRAGRR